MSFKIPSIFMEALVNITAKVGSLSETVRYQVRKALMITEVKRKNRHNDMAMKRCFPQKMRRHLELGVQDF